MKSNRIFLTALVFITILALFSFVSPSYAATVTNLVDFNNTSDLTNLFNPSSSPTFTNIGSSGISNSGGINVPLGSDEIWTTKQGYSVSGVGDIYTFSAFFKIKANSGYGGLGFSSADTNQTDMYGSPVKGIGMIFHGGGGFFVNNRVNTAVSWPPDLVLGNWYKMILKVTAKGSNAYDLDFQIWNSDSDGNLGTMKTEKTMNGLVNADLGGASIIHGYFSAAGSRMEKIDNFLIQLEGGTSFVEQGLPVVLTDTTTNIGENAATSGGNVTDTQGSSVTIKGICWSGSASPTVGGNCTNDGSGLGHFSSNITGLTTGTSYHVRSYATNSSGTSYGSENIFTTSGTAPTPSSSSSSSSTNSSGSVSTPSCGDATPFGAPDVFQIDVNDTHATLYYTPLSNNISNYYVSFSEISNTFRYGALTGQGPSSGVLSYTVNFLQPNTTYYFKVRGQNGCMPGNFSNELKITTKAKGTSKLSSFYRYTISP